MKHSYDILYTLAAKPVLRIHGVQSTFHVLYAKKFVTVPQPML